MYALTLVQTIYFLCHSVVAVCTVEPHSTLFAARAVYRGLCNKPSFVIWSAHNFQVAEAAR